ncbi:hypothetical protein Ddye_013501 [Dipteronia dyeriana]|uniref:TIR domain-containing protein n=1 Tax=Dipteronia dyeriana TaxID=168575 RepID=A0AAD9X6E9_9ROSI|nr:hypothetical protein Ddye_013501 [Dipteronia dyeriana]
MASSKFDVFLSFRGEDTRSTFTSLLHAALCRRKIQTFIDYDLRKGDEISPALEKTIEDSCLSIIILSENYASSTWCLNELVKILECKKAKGQIVLPVFYHVLPSHVRKQSGSYGEAFAKHETFFNNKKADKVSTWRSALTQVTNFSGWDLKQHDGSESEFIEKIVKDVLKKLKHVPSGDHLDGLVGMSSRIDKVDSLLCMGTEDCRILGIWGMAGVGKTTIARAIFNRIANQFESCCFLANFREESAKCGLNNLQEKLLSEILEDPNLTTDAFTLNRLCRKKVLIVLDDVNNAQHLKHLVGDRRWFGPGSRIIITSRDIQVLKMGTNAVESISLDLSQINELHLNSDAFMRMQRLKFLKFYSSHYSKGKKEKDKVHLREGLELLPDELRYLHWHRYPLRFLPPKIDPENLVELQMHHSSVEHLWEENQFNLEKLRRIDLSHSQHLAEIPNLSGASNLQTMVLNGCSKITKFPQISWNIKELKLSQTAIEEVPSAIEYLNQLRSLELNYCTRLQNLPSNIRNLTSLTQLSLQGCSSITEFPDISGDVSVLYLDGTAIDQVPSSIERLTKLHRLSLKYCTRLKRVSSSIFKLQSLSFCILSGCSRLDDLPEVLETKGNLEGLYLDRTSIKKLPATIEFLPQLNDLNTGYCKCIESLPNSICNMKSLSSLDLSGCLGVDKMLEDLPLSSSSGLSSLNMLNLSKCNLSSLPSALSCLPYLKSLNVSGNNFESLSLTPFACLEELNISHCKRLQSLQEFPLPSHLLDLQAHHCISLETLPTSNVVFTGNWITEQSSIYYNCLKLDANARVNIMADAQLRIQVMATKARETSSLEDYLKDGEVHEIVCDIDGMKIDGRLGFLESDHVFLVYAHELSTVFQRDDGEHNLSIYSSCQEALFEFSHVDKDLQPIPNCKIKKCGVHLLYLEEETNQISGDDSLNEAGHVENGGDGIQNIVEDEEVPNPKRLKH